MSREIVYEKLNNIFREIFDNDSIVITDNTVADDIEGWDSLEHINLITAIEDDFNIKFTMRELSNMKKVGDMVDLILSK